MAVWQIVVVPTYAMVVPIEIVLAAWKPHQKSYYYLRHDIDDWETPDRLEIAAVNSANWRTLCDGAKTPCLRVRLDHWPPFRPPIRILQLSCNILNDLGGLTSRRLYEWRIFWERSPLALLDEDRRLRICCLRMWSDLKK